MNDNNICELSEKCPIYSGVLKSEESLTSAYKSIYCNNGEEGKSKCKRYQVAKIMCSCADNVLPNSYLSVKQILEQMYLDENKKNTEK